MNQTRQFSCQCSSLCCSLWMLSCISRFNLLCEGLHLCRLPGTEPNHFLCKDAQQCQPVRLGVPMGPWFSKVKHGETVKPCAPLCPPKGLRVLEPDSAESACALSQVKWYVVTAVWKCMKLKTLLFSNTRTTVVTVQGTNLFVQTNQWELHSSGSCRVQNHSGQASHLCLTLLDNLLHCFLKVTSLQRVEQCRSSLTASL